MEEKGSGSVSMVNLFEDMGNYHDEKKLRRSAERVDRRDILTDDKKGECGVDE